jgi:hypothetical protein
MSGRPGPVPRRWVLGGLSSLPPFHCRVIVASLSLVVILIVVACATSPGGFLTARSACRVVVGAICTSGWLRLALSLAYLVMAWLVAILCVSATCGTLPLWSSSSLAGWEEGSHIPLGTTSCRCSMLASFAPESTSRRLRLLLVVWSCCGHFAVVLLVVDLLFLSSPSY